MDSCSSCSLSRRLKNAFSAFSRDQEPSAATSLAAKPCTRAARPVRVATSYSLITRRQSLHPARCALSLACSSTLNSPAVAAAQSSRNSSCGPIGQMPRLPFGFQVVTHALSPVQFVASYVLSKLFKASIVMISDVGVGLTQLLGNLCECVAFKEVQLQRVALVGR